MSNDGQIFPIVNIASATLHYDTRIFPPHRLNASFNPITKMRKYIAEFIGTFFSCLLSAALLSCGGRRHSCARHCAVLMVMIFAGGHISGGHFNPAVTFAVFVRGNWSLKTCSILAGSNRRRHCRSARRHVSRGKGGTPMEITNVPAAFVAEFLFTFALAYVVVNCATAKGTLDNIFYGLAIGFTVLAGIFAVGGFLAARSIRRSRSARR